MYVVPSMYLQGCTDDKICYSLDQVDCISERPSTTTMVSQQDAGTAVAMSYENPEDNTIFCGQTYGSITGQCLTSKPCPSGNHSSCLSTEGCYSVPICTYKYSDYFALTAVINSIDAQATLVSVCDSDYNNAVRNF